jgi:hypothetical protein
VAVSIYNGGNLTALADLILYNPVRRSKRFFLASSADFGPVGR